MPRALFAEFYGIFADQVLSSAYSIAALRSSCLCRPMYLDRNLYFNGVIASGFVQDNNNNNNNNNNNI